MSTGNINQSDVMTLTNNQVVRSGKIFSSFFGFEAYDYTISSENDTIDSSDKTLINLQPSLSITFKSTPHITSGFDGQILIFRGSSDTNTLIFQDESSLSGSGMNLGGVNRTLGEADYLILMYSDISLKWEEIIYKDN